MNIQKIREILGEISSRIEFDEEKHTYFCDEEELISVSGFITPWNESFNNMMDPNHKSYNRALASSMPYFQNRGTRIHKYSEDVDRGFMKHWDNDLREYEIYYKFFYNTYIKSGKWEVVVIEAPIFSTIYKVAGTVDRIYRDTQTNQIYLLDVKSGATQPVNEYQQAMYYDILKELGIKIDKCFLLSLKKGCHLKEIPMENINKRIKEIGEYYK